MHVLARLALAVLIVGIPGAMHAAPASACQCIAVEEGESRTADSESVFAGTVIRQTVEGGRNVAVIRVTRVYKGEPWAMRKVWPGGGQDDSGGQWATSCDASIWSGQTYLFVTTGGRVDICSVYAADEDWIADELGAGEPPDPDLIPSSLQPREEKATPVREVVESPEEEEEPERVAAELPVEESGGFPSWAISLIVVAAVFGTMAGVALMRARSRR